MGDEVKIANEAQILGTGEPSNARKIFDLGLWNNGSSNLFRSREPESL